MKVDCQKCDNVVEIPQSQNVSICTKCGYQVFRPRCKWCNNGECPECGGDGLCSVCGNGFDIGCENCDGTGECYVCDGSGDCIDCDGTGYEQ